MLLRIFRSIVRWIRGDDGADQFQESFRGREGADDGMDVTEDVTSMDVTESVDEGLVGPVPADQAVFPDQLVDVGFLRETQLIVDAEVVVRVPEADLHRDHLPADTPELVPEPAGPEEIPTPALLPRRSHRVRRRPDRLQVSWDRTGTYDRVAPSLMTNGGRMDFKLEDQKCSHYSNDKRRKNRFQT